MVDHLTDPNLLGLLVVFAIVVIAAFRIVKGR